MAPDEKWIAVNLSEQTLVAYEDNRMVFATLVSTGLPWWRTPEGLLQVWVKLYRQDERRECGGQRLLLLDRQTIWRYANVSTSEDVPRTGSERGDDKMSMMVKGLKIVGLGVAIWGLSLLWPEVNLVLTPPVMIGVVLGFAVVARLACILVQYLDQRHNHEETGQDHTSPDISGSDSIAALNTA